MNAVMAKAFVEELGYIECIDRLVAIAEPPQGLLARASAAFERSGANTPPARERHGRKFRRDTQPESR
jgi:hypothetical protein